MQIQVPETPSFDCPEGIHEATLYKHFEVTEARDSTIHPSVRLQFKIDALSKPNKPMLVAKSYRRCLEPRSELRRVIETWKGPGFIEKHRTDQGFEFNLLQGSPAIVKVVHFKNPNYGKPYVCLAAIMPPGLLTGTGNTDQTQAVTNVKIEPKQEVDESFETAIPVNERKLLTELASLVVKNGLEGQSLRVSKLFELANADRLKWKEGSLDNIEFKRIVAMAFAGGNSLVLDGYTIDCIQTVQTYFNTYTIRTTTNPGQSASPTTKTKSSNV